MINILDIKKKLRVKQTKIRQDIYYSKKNFFNLKLFEKLFTKIDIDNKNIISSFISIKSEINTENLNKFILNKNITLCLPSILKKDEALVFRKFNHNDNLIDGYMKIKEPPLHNEVLIPNIFFVPCLAFDKFGFRLGYGGGYYDRTFSHLKKNKIKFISIGYAFDGQKISQIPKDKFDIKLDYVITEKKIYSFV